MDRETGFEPATPSLEGWRSTTELFPHRGPRRDRTLSGRPATPPSFAAPSPANRTPSPRWWRGEDLNPRRRSPADLQSAPFGQLGYLPAYPQTVTPRDEALNRLKCLALAGGFEPPTHCLQGSCSTPELRQQSQNFTLGPTSM